MQSGLALNFIDFGRKGNAEVNQKDLAFSVNPDS